MVDPRELTHAPPGYDCPFCRYLAALDGAGPFDENNQPSDLVVREELVLARVAPKWWPANSGGLLVIPTGHVEHLYAMSAEVGHAVFDLTKRLAVAMRASYDCTGVSTRQHNEPDGDQDVWHFHQHLLPRQAGDELYLRHSETTWIAPEIRAPYASLLLGALE